MSLAVVPDDLSRPDTLALIALHQGQMLAETPPGHAFVLGGDALRQPDVFMFSVQENGRVIAIGALKLLGDGTGELKSMRTHPDHLRKGAAALLLDRLIEQGRTLGLKRLSLETGTAPQFEPALALYRNRGFRDGPVFADYPPDSPHNCYLHLEL
jgi:putative acetyltransferase